MKHLSKTRVFALLPLFLLCVLLLNGQTYATGQHPPAGQPSPDRNTAIREREAQRNAEPQRRERKRNESLRRRMRERNQALQGQGSTRLPTAVPAKRAIHLLLVADTKDSQVGSSCRETIRYFQNSFVPSLKEHTGLVVKAQYIYGEDFERSNVNARLRELQTLPDDAIVFYFAGHGYNRGLGKFPTIILSDYSPTVERQRDLTSIYNELKAKAHGLLVVVGETCNRVYADINHVKSYPHIERLNAAVNEGEQYVDLFAKSKGDYIISSSSVGEYSNLVTGNPGYFTCAWRDVLQGLPALSKERPFTWTGFLGLVRERTKESNRLNGDVQIPQWQQE